MHSTRILFLYKTCRSIIPIITIYSFLNFCGKSDYITMSAIGRIIFIKTIAHAISKTMISSNLQIQQQPHDV